eukprot:878420-Pyramimonas_sp.AAC.1
MARNISKAGEAASGGAGGGGTEGPLPPKAAQQTARTFCTRAGLFDASPEPSVKTNALQYSVPDAQSPRSSVG